jgi:hypothetical protein
MVQLKVETSKASGRINSVKIGASIDDPSKPIHFMAVLHALPTSLSNITPQLVLDTGRFEYHHSACIAVELMANMAQLCSANLDLRPLAQPSSDSTSSPTSHLEPPWALRHCVPRSVADEPTMSRR